MNYLTRQLGTYLIREKPKCELEAFSLKRFLTSFSSNQKETTDNDPIRDQKRGMYVPQQFLSLQELCVVVKLMLK